MRVFRFGWIFIAVCGLCALSMSAIGKTNRLKPFFTDGCSNWIDGTLRQPHLWRHCCVAHDKAYWLGGTAEQRKIADDELRACLKDETSKAMTDYMYYMVRWGGHPDWLTWYRWGYGWDYLDNGEPRGYKTPTPEEQQQIDVLMPQAEKIIENDALSHPIN